MQLRYGPTGHGSILYLDRRNAFSRFLVTALLYVHCFGQSWTVFGILLVISPMISIPLFLFAGGMLPFECINRSTSNCPFLSILDADVQYSAIMVYSMDSMVISPAL